MLEAREKFERDHPQCFQDVEDDYLKNKGPPRSQPASIFAERHDCLLFMAIFVIIFLVLDLMFPNKRSDMKCVY